MSTAHLSRELLFHVYIENDFYAYADGSSYVQVEHPNDSVTLKVRVHGDDLTDVTYQWYENDTEEDEEEGVPTGRW